MPTALKLCTDRLLAEFKGSEKEISELGSEQKMELGIMMGAVDCRLCVQWQRYGLPGCRHSGLSESMNPLSPECGGKFYKEPNRQTNLEMHFVR
jgi:hypothetical protein